MRVLMLGWEFPPFISGGLGTACYGLTKALSRRQTQILFVLPKAIQGEFTTHVRLLSPQAPQAEFGSRTPQSVASTYQIDDPIVSNEGFSNVTFKAVPSRIVSPYQSVPGPTTSFHQQSANAPAHARPIRVLGSGPQNNHPHHPHAQGQDYGGDLMAEAKRYADLCVDMAAGHEFDVIHAHDWLTFPAGLAVAAATGKPLVVHVHSTEFDRAGEDINQQVYDIERRGVHGAIRVMAVSHLTQSIIQHRYGVDHEKIDVVYNGIDNNSATASVMARSTIRKADKIVLFLGRITMQKGPEYFIEAASKVLDKFDRVKFVMAGSGDKITQIIELAAAQGIGHKILFTGFLRGPDVQRVFKMADVYVMPSVSEPFGIAPLEAISHDVPVIISKTSGVAEVLTHALKVDFWDTDEIANKIIAVLKHPPLSSTLRQHADFEVRRLTWDDAADKCISTYQAAIDAMPQ